MFLDIEERYGIIDGMNPDQIDDARNSAGLSLMDQVLLQIRDNLTAINRKQDTIGTQVQDMNARVIRLEEREERLERLEKLVEKQDGKIDVLLRDKDQRDGAGQVFVGIRGWTPVIIAILSAVASIATALYLSGRAAGVVPAPPGYIAQKPQDGK